MATSAFTAQYLVTSTGSSTGLLDLGLNYGTVTTVGQNIQYKGSAAVDAVFLRHGISVDFTASGAGVDKLYLEGNFADYKATLSSKFVVLTRTVNGLTEKATLAAGDSLVFADGFMSTDDLISRLKLKIKSSPALNTSEKSTDPHVQLDGQSTIKATALGKTGVTFAQGVQGVALTVLGSAGVDTVYVKAGTQVDASGLGAEQDLIYFTGNYANYTKTVSGNTLVLERTVNGYVEKITLATTGDKAVFADGSALTDAIKANVDANADQSTLPTGWQTTETTPTAYSDVQAITFDAAKSSRVKNGTFKSNDVLVFNVKFKQAVDVTGSPKLALNMGGQTVYADYDSALTGKSNTDLKFKYTVHAGDLDDNGVSILQSAANNSAISLNGGSINLTGAGGKPAQLIQTPALNQVATAKVDAVAPTITASYSTDENTAIEKAIKSISLLADEAVTWSGLSGPDAKAFTLGSGKNAGKLLFKSVTNFEAKSNYSVTVTGTDAVGNKTTQDLAINLKDINEAPVVATPLVNQVFASGSTNTYTLPRAAFQDVDANDVLTYKATQTDGTTPLPDWLKFDSDTQTFTGIAPEAKTPVTVRVTATDKQGASVYNDFKISFSTAPVVQSLAVADNNASNGEALGKAGETLTLQLMLSVPVVSTRALTAVFTVGGKEVTANHAKVESATNMLTFTLDVPPNANGTVSLKSLVADSKGVIHAISGGAVLIAPKPGAIADQHYVVDTQAPSITTTYSVVENTATDTTPKGITLLANEAVAWSTLTGTDAEQFTLGTGDSAGMLLFKAPTNYEAQKSYTVTITGTDAAGNAKSQNIAINLTNVNEAPAGSVTLGGTPTQGQVLTASHTLVDPEGPSTLVVSYKWQVSADGNSGWTDISGAKASTFTLTEAQVGKYVRVVASYTDGAGVLEAVNSDPTNTAIANTNDAPTGSLNLTGTPKTGQVLTATHTLADADGIGTISYQWQTSADGTSNWSDIVGATDSTFTLAQVQVGKFVRVVASYTDGHGTAEIVNSNTTSGAVLSSLTAVIKGFDKYGDDTDGIVESSLTDVVGAKMTDLSWWNFYSTAALLEGTTEAGATVNFTLGGQTRSSTADNAGYWNYRLTADDFANVGAGAETITVTSITDKDGYTSQTQITRNVTFNAVADTMSHPEDGYGSDYIDALVEGGTGWAGKVITYSFAPGSGLAAWTSAEKAAFKKACAAYSNVCNLQFVEGTYNSDDYLATSIAVSKVPNSTWTTEPGWSVLADFNLPTEDFNGFYGALNGRFNYQHSSWSNQIEGGLSFNTIMHELGHGLGLAHPFDGNPLFPGVPFNGWTDLGDNNLSQGIWTIMAYNHDWKDSPAGSYNWGFAKTPMTFDIAAMQAMYGANITYRTGNDTYTLPTSEIAGTGWECIWDAGGIDTISNAGASASCNINLNAYPKTGGKESEPYVSYNVSSQIAGGFTVADGVIIENAVGGNGNDTLIGNAVSNQLIGNGGADKFVFNTALSANNIDTLIDFAATDQLVLDKTIFTAFQGSTTVNANQLYAGAGATTAADEDDYLIYNTSTGALYYDQDGSGSTYATVQFAVLQTKPSEISMSQVLLA